MKVGGYLRPGTVIRRATVGGSPVIDNPTHHFHQWVARKLQAA
jgi:hypothetical protein